MNVSINNLAVKQNLIFSPTIPILNPTGPTGMTGMTGPVHDVGYTGKGIRGPRGPKGSKGKAGRGYLGPKGPTGPPGKSGKGPTGPTGPRGSSATGPTGPTGPVGESLTGSEGGTITEYTSVTYSGEVAVNGLNNVIKDLNLGTGNWLVKWNMNVSFYSGFMSMFYGSISSTPDIYGRYQPLDSSGNIISNWYVYLPNNDITLTDYPIVGADPTGSNSNLMNDTVYTNGLSISDFSCVPIHSHTISDPIYIDTNPISFEIQPDTPQDTVFEIGGASGVLMHQHSINYTTYSNTNLYNYDISFSSSMNSIYSSNTQPNIISRTYIWYIYYSNQ